MWMQNGYVRILAGLLVVVTLTLLMMPSPGVADGAAETRRGCGDTTIDGNGHCESCPHADATRRNPSHQAAPRRVTPDVLQVAASLDAPTTILPAPAITNDTNATMPGLPAGEWSKATPLGRITMTIDNGKITIDCEGSGEMAMFQPTLRGEYSVASDGTVYGLIHTVDLGASPMVAQEMGEELLMLSSLSDIPFSMRAYSEPGLLAIKQVTFGVPMQLMIATDGDISEISAYAQPMLAGQYDPAD